MDSIKTIEPNSSEAYVAACAAVMVSDNEVNQSELTESLKAAIKSKLVVELAESPEFKGGALNELASGFTAEEYRETRERLHAEDQASAGEMNSGEVEEHANSLLEEFDAETALVVIANIKSAWDDAQEDDSQFELLDIIADKIGPELSSFVLSSCLDVAEADGTLQNEEGFILAHFASRWGLEDYLCSVLQAKTGRQWAVVTVGGRNILVPSDEEQDTEEEQPEMSELWQAIMKNDSQKAIDLVKAGALVNDVIDVNSDIRDISPLMIAAEHYDKTLVQALIDAGANIDAKASMGYVPLTWALKGDNMDTFRLLLAAGADPDPLESGEGDFSPLSMAAKHGLEEALTDLIVLDVNVNWTDTSGRSALREAVMQGHAGCVKLLLEAGAYPATSDVEGYAPIHNAASAGNLEIITLLLDAGVDVNTPLISPAEHEGETAIHSACYAGHMAIVMELMRRGADTNGNGNPIQDAIVGAREHSEDPTDMVRYMLDNGTKADIEALLAAVLVAPVSTVKVLFEHMTSKESNLPEGWIDVASKAISDVLSNEADEQRRSEIKRLFKMEGPALVNLSKAIEEHNAWFHSKQDQLYTWYKERGKESIQELPAEFSDELQGQGLISSEHRKYILDNGDYSFLLVGPDGSADKLSAGFELSEESTDLGEDNSMTATIAGPGMDLVRYIPANGQYEFPLIINDGDQPLVDPLFLGAVDETYEQRIDELLSEFSEIPGYEDVGVKDVLRGLLISNLAKILCHFYYKIPWADFDSEFSSRNELYRSLVTDTFSIVSEPALEKCKEELIELSQDEGGESE